jgi:hypothetical protein
MIEEVQTAGKQHGFRLTRLWANMEWALEDLRGVHDIVEYEARLNYLLPNYNDVVVCTYDVTKFSASVVGHHAQSSQGNRRRRAARKSVLRASGRFAARPWRGARSVLEPSPCSSAQHLRRAGVEYFGPTCQAWRPGDPSPMLSASATAIEA